MSWGEYLRGRRIARAQRENLKERRRIASACLAVHIVNATAKAGWADVVKRR